MAFNTDVWQIDPKAVIFNIVLLSGFALIGGYFIPLLTGTYQRGFFCNDLSIRYPYKASTVSGTCLILYAFVVMIFTIFIVELYYARTSKRNIHIQYKFGSITVHPVMVTVLTYTGYSQIGLAITYVVTNLTKNAVGRLRPHFLDVCKPSDLICSFDNHSTFITDYTCTGDAQSVLEARKSFFSGHSSISMYASTFAVLYLQSRLQRKSIVKVVLPLLQTTIILSGLLISYSRISDNKHHWSDVIVGIFVGVFLASYNCIVWSKMFDRRECEILPIRQANQISYGNSSRTPVNTSKRSSSNVDRKDVYTPISDTHDDLMRV